MISNASEHLFARAQRVTPGGVNSPVRAFGSVGGSPRFIHRAEGARLWDVDGNEYVDLVGSWGPMILGHSHPAVVAAVAAALRDGTSFGAPTAREVELAEKVLERYPGCEQVRFVNSGTEATMSALRLARGATGRDTIVKFAGNYHGHADLLLVAAGSGLLTSGIASSAGVPHDSVKHTLVARYNDPDGLASIFTEHGADIAAVILEPVAGNMGVVAPSPAFLDSVRSLTRQHGALLVVDEVMTGFRLSRGGAIELHGLEADIVCWGKIVGGGLPVGAYGASAALMRHLAPLGAVYQAGTLSGNPLAMAAGCATLDAIDADPHLYARLETLGQRLEDGLLAAAHEAGVDVVVNRVGSMLTLFFTGEPVTDLESATTSDTARFARWFHGMLDGGVYWPPSQFEAAFLSSVLEEADIDSVVEVARRAFEAAGRD
ncbi:MAG TPA: glutamate-1-semialdehyde 2,1-aminomutase [Trueperaceae bacterium]|nr:glutamate-1-semialdehyde 2,1-aminomutase [Trueperaceae bacterium]